MLKVNDVVTIQLINGAEIIGKFQDETSSEIVLYKPRMVQVQEQGQVALIPAVCMTGEEPNGDVKFYKTGLTLMCKTVPQLTTDYNTSTSGIITPTAGILKQ